MACWNKRANESSYFYNLGFHLQLHVYGLETNWVFLEWSYFDLMVVTIAVVILRQSRWMKEIRKHAFKWRNVWTIIFLASKSVYLRYWFAFAILWLGFRDKQFHGFFGMELLWLDRGNYTKLSDQNACSQIMKCMKYYFLGMVKQVSKWKSIFTVCICNSLEKFRPKLLYWLFETVKATIAVIVAHQSRWR